MNYESLTADVVERVHRAGELLRREREEIRLDEIQVKGQGDFVSRADRMAEDLLREELEALLPGSVVMGEEASPEARGGDWRWIVDPLDGTTNYLHGLPVYAVSVALEDRRGDPEHFGPRVVGVIHAPALGSTWSAWTGGGLWRDGQRVGVRRNDRLDRALIATGFPFRTREEMGGYLEIFTRLFPRVSDMRRAGAAALDLAWVADGTLDGFFEMDLKPWDLAAGVLMIEEGGGRATDWWGDDPLRTGWTVCGTELAHESMRKVIDAVGFERPGTLWR